MLIRDILKKLDCHEKLLNWIKPKETNFNFNVEQKFYQSELCIQFKILTMNSVFSVQSHFVFVHYYIWKHLIQEWCLKKQWLEGYWAFGTLFP